MNLQNQGTQRSIEKKENKIETRSIKQNIRKCTFYHRIELLKSPKTQKKKKLATRNEKRKRRNVPFTANQKTKDLKRKEIRNEMLRYK
jgi:hypothetical protein